MKNESGLTLVQGALTTEQLLRILQRTPKSHVYQRPAKGGGMWDYVTGVYVKKVLNYTFGWMWSFEVKEVKEKYGQVIVQGRLTIHKPDGTALIWKEDIGRQDIKFRTENTIDPVTKQRISRKTDIPLDYGNDEKGAVTDCLKRCSAQLGIASDIYGKNEFKEVNEALIADLPNPKAEAIIEPVELVKADGDVVSKRLNNKTA